MCFSKLVVNINELFNILRNNGFLFVKLWLILFVMWIIFFWIFCFLIEIVNSLFFIWMVFIIGYFKKVGCKNMIFILFFILFFVNFLREVIEFFWYVRCEKLFGSWINNFNGISINWYLFFIYF